jgi:hypothetical protein
MKSILKITGIVLGISVLLVGAAALLISTRGIPTYETKKIDYQLVSTPQSITRGKKLTLILCAYCHLNRENGKLTGSRMREAPLEFGTIFSKNITQDKKYGIGSWTDGELVYLLRTGIGRDGQYIPPYMAKLKHMADDDINAIISFLRSDDPIVAADSTPDRASDVSFLTKALCNTVWKPMEMPDHKIPPPDSTNKVALGKYLAQNLECFSCHSADFKTNDFENPENSKGYFGGGNKTLNAEGDVVMTSNLTPDKETGIGNWNEERFIKAVRFSVMEGEASLRYPMVPYVLLTDYEVSSIFSYLNTLPAIKNKVERKINVAGN